MVSIQEILSIKTPPKKPLKRALLHYFKTYQIIKQKKYSPYVRILSLFILMFYTASRCEKAHANPRPARAPNGVFST